MNRPRNENETYQQYRKTLREEERQTRMYLRGNLVWCSSALVTNKKNPLGPLVKVLVDGTYVKPKQY